jgi:hypothetical protein
MREETGDLHAALAWLAEVFGRVKHRCFPHQIGEQTAELSDRSQL